MRLLLSIELSKNVSRSFKDSVAPCFANDTERFTNSSEGYACKSKRLGKFLHEVQPLLAKTSCCPAMANALRAA